MLTALVTVWAASLVVLAALLALVVVAQGTYAFARRLGSSWRARAAAPVRSSAQPALAGRAGR